MFGPLYDASSMVRLRLIDHRIGETSDVNNHINKTWLSTTTKVIVLKIC